MCTARLKALRPGQPSPGDGFGRPKARLEEPASPSLVPKLGLSVPAWYDAYMKVCEVYHLQDPPSTSPTGLLTLTSRSLARSFSITTTTCLGGPLLRMAYPSSLHVQVEVC